MPEKFKPTDAAIYFTRGFIQKHIFVGSSGDKKKSEKVFLRRGVAISTVFCLTKAEFVKIAGEVHSRQEEFAAKPNKPYKTKKEYDHWTRGGARGKDKKRATPGRCRLPYKVRRVTQQGEVLFVVAHLEPVKAPR